MPELDAFTHVLDGPMYVVTAAAGGQRAGCLVGFASQCSIHPPRFVVWLSTANHTYRVAREASYLTVHALRRDQLPLAELFGGRTGDRVDKFARAGWRPGEEGSPVLTEVDTWFTGRVEGQIEGGDHVGFLLAPARESPPAEGPPPALLRYGDVRGLKPGHPA
ncbi:flavin reductase [Streptomyces sp. ISL-44]|uniref:flavin reductase family protein n=1 Tax=unclassified Streptomyces TaxID=2593676 RepID=UPI001BEBA420|nr:MULTISPECIES: flavin reductase family protein [unclassified Streptomyces]MBT2540816.1 flavin reductase [Streptomyces sp. ISL-44]MCX5009951.1 flavin reductase family protein [Streptomyces sp. NBC_00555]MCX5610381.1 flavin reductase family protein [Streptomyces sp. NBC_00047]UUU38340.1 flavin reductase family protein [Streptomyces sp. NBC_00162]